MKQQYGKKKTIAVATLMAVAGLQSLGVKAAGDNLPALGESSEPWKVEYFYENDTRVRGKDNTGNRVGLSKFRNTLQIESDKKFGNGWAFHGILRGTYDGVYRLNEDEFGRNAGSERAADLKFNNTAGPAIAASGMPLPPVHMGTTVPYGGGIGFTVVDAIQAGAGLPNLGGPAGGPGVNKFIDPNYANLAAPPVSYGSAEGLRVLGDRWNDHRSGIAFAVPVRPCDSDKRGCKDFGGYGDKDMNELEMPEFNDRLDFIREAYLKKTYTLADGSDLFLKLGRQQVVWGRTDLFRVLDVINPVDYSRNNIYDELQDIRIPMWIAQAEWRFGGSESMQERNLQLVWNFDKFRPNNLGQCGTANTILDAGCFFRGMTNIWDNGGTVSNFAGFAPPGTPAAATGPFIATNFPAHVLGIREVHLPAWSLSNTQLGMKFEGVTQGGLNFSLNALTYRSQLPSLRSINMTHGAINPFTGAPGNTSPFSGPAQGVPTTHMIAFDMHYPRVNLLGGSMDFQIESANAAVRIEGALTKGEEFANTARPKLYSENKVWRSVIGVDRPTFIPFISETRTTLLSAQLFWQHIFDHESYAMPGGKVGMPDWEDNLIGTFLMKAFLMNDRLSPQVILARDFRAHAWAIAPSVEWSVTNDLKLTLGGNFKGRSDQERWNFDDCRSCNPFAPYTMYTGQGFNPGSNGVSGIEPLGRFRAGPIGTAWREDELHLTLRYKF